jgi:hypothetical protein
MLPIVDKGTIGSIANCQTYLEAAVSARTKEPFTGKNCRRPEGTKTAAVAAAKNAISDAGIDRRKASE